MKDRLSSEGLRAIVDGIEIDGLQPSIGGGRCRSNGRSVVPRKRGSGVRCYEQTVENIYQVRAYLKSNNRQKGKLP